MILNVSKTSIVSLLVKRAVLTFVTNYAVIVFYVPSVLKNMAFCRTVTSIFITSATYFLKAVMLGLILYITSSFQTTNSRCAVYFVYNPCAARTCV
jgi:hypothetical protein